jgi:hypothetical protein
MSSTTINGLSMPQFLDSLNRAFTTVKPDPLDDIMLNSPMVRKESIPLGTGATRVFTERLSTDQYASQGVSGAPAKQARVQYGYEKALSVEQHDKSVSIDPQTRLLGKYQEIIAEVTNLVPAGRREIDLALAHRFSFATATSYGNSGGATVDTTGADGLPMLSAVHPTSGSPRTWSNIVPGNPQFSKAALTVGLKVGVENTMDNLGQKLQADYNVILTTDDPDTVIAVKELVNATANVDSNNAGTFNYFGNGFKHIMSKRIATDKDGFRDSTKSKYWFLISPTFAPIVYGEAMAPTAFTPAVGNNGVDFMTQNWNYLVQAQWGICMPSARGIIGSTPVSA